MDNDAILATETVKKLFKHINLCLQNDRSKVKINMLEKGIIKGMSTDNTLKGLNGYINNMYASDLTNLLNDIFLNPMALSYVDKNRIKTDSLLEKYKFQEIR